MKLGEHLLSSESKSRLFDSTIITHKNCPDGSAAAVIAKKIFPRIAVFPSNHNYIDNQFEKALKYLANGEKLFIVDICCSQSKLESALPVLLEKKIYIGIYEHHESNRWLETFKLPYGLSGEIIFDEKRCGSKIFYDRYVGEYSELKDFEEFITVNNDRDLWINQHPLSADIAKLHQILGDESYVSRFLENPKMEFTEKEQIILDYEKESERKKHEILLKGMQVKERDNEGFRYGVVYGEADSSNLLNLAIKRFDLEYAILVNLNTKKASIRSRGNKNCVTFAEKFGGGGHRCSAGFRIQFQYPQF